MQASTRARDYRLLTVAALWPAILIRSGLHPHDHLTWFMETAPVMLALPIMFATYRRMPLTPLLYGAIFVHGVILMAGGAYAYARVPLGFELANWLHQTRNPDGKIGHFAQGFVPALVAREIFLRGGYVRGPRMLGFLVIGVALAISAVYELIEWGSAVALGQGAEEFLGALGDPWDTQSDRLFALLGSVTAVVTLSRWHDRASARVAPPLSAA